MFLSKKKEEEERQQIYLKILVELQVNFDTNDVETDGAFDLERVY